MTPATTGIGVVAAGLVAMGSTAGTLVIAATSADPTVWTTGGIGSAAVGSLLYLIKRMTDGSLVSVKIADVISDATKREDRLRAEAETREAKLRDLAKRGQDREDLLWALLRGKGDA